MLKYKDAINKDIYKIIIISKCSMNVLDNDVPDYKTLKLLNHNLGNVQARLQALKKEVEEYCSL